MKPSFFGVLDVYVLVCRLFETGRTEPRRVPFLEILEARGFTRIPITDTERLGGDLNVVVTQRGRTAIAPVTRRHQEFLKFLRRLDRAFPRDLTLHGILDNYGTHKHATVRKWLAAHPRFRLHFTPTSTSWLNLVESWFSKLTQQRLRRGVFCSVEELVAAIDDYLTHYNVNPKPFVWSTTVNAILDKVRKCKVILGTDH